MNTSEIIDRYQRKHTSISVLAELNACSPKEIKDILIDAGILLRSNKKPEPEQEKIKMPAKLAGAHKHIVKEIQEEINVHKSAAVQESINIKNERKRLKEEALKLLQEFKDFEAIRKVNIQVHKDAVKELELELKEENEFFKMFS
jgi:PDZ domain-containing secreted protein